MWKIQSEQDFSRIIKRNLRTNDGNKETFSHFSIHWFPCKPHKLIWMALVRIYCVESSIQVEASERGNLFCYSSDLIKHKNVSIKALKFAHVESGHVNEIPTGFRVLSLLHGPRAGIFTSREPHSGDPRKPCTLRTSRVKDSLKMESLASRAIKSL